MLKEIIDKYYQDKNNERERKKFYISEAGKCPRQIFFKFKKAPCEEMEPRILRVFDQGDYIHLRLMRTLFSLGVIIAAEIDIPPKEDIGGRADAIIRINNELYLVDFKSVNSMILKNMKEPKEEHILQVQLYLHFFNLKKGIILYEGKDNSQIEEFVVEYDKKIADKVLNDFKRLRAHNVDKNLVPQQLSDFPDNWQCQYCQFREICEMGGPQNIKWEDFKKNIENHDRSDANK